MRPTALFSALLALALVAGPAAGEQTAAAGAAAVHAGEQWTSYRDAYRAMLWFEKFGGPKQFIENRYRVVAKEKGASLEGLRLSLVGKSMHLALPLDATGRAGLPLLKAAYDENAELLLNRAGAQFAFQTRASIVVRPDGVYELTDLRAACEQVLAYQRYLDPGALRGHRCSGVRFAYLKKEGEPELDMRSGGAAPQALAASDGGAFWDDADSGFRVVDLRFARAPERGQVLTHSAPVAIGPLFD